MHLAAQALYFCLGSDNRGKANAALHLLGALARHSAQSARGLAQALDWSLPALLRLARVPQCATACPFCYTQASRNSPWDAASSAGQGEPALHAAAAQYCTGHKLLSSAGRGCPDGLKSLT